MSDIWTGVLGGGTLVGLVTIMYTIWKERNKNRQEDKQRSLDLEKDDLTLGEYFRVVARQEVEAVQAQMNALQHRLAERDSVCEGHTQQLRSQAVVISLMQARYRAAEAYVATLLQEWGKRETPPPPPADFRMGDMGNT